MFIKSIVEECTEFLKNKTYIIVLFILPILITLLIGVTFTKKVITDIPIAVIDYDNTAFSKQLIDSFDQNETFNVTDYPSSTDHLESLIRNSEVRAGLIIPEDFYSDIVALKSPTVLMVYDGSHMSITSVAKSKAVEILLTYKAGATISQLMSRLNLSYEEAYNITQAFQFNTRVLYNSSKSFEDFLAPILLAGVLQVAVVLMASQAINYDVFYKKRKKRIGYSLGKVIFYTLGGSLSFLICILIQVKVFDMPFAGSLGALMALSVALCFASTSFSVLISTVIKNRMVALVGNAVVFIPNSIMAGTTWPLNAMPTGYQGFAKYMPFAHYVNNMRDIYLKGFSFQDVSGDIRYLFTFGIIVILISELVILVSQQESYGKELDNNDLSKDIQETIPVNT